ncbi:MAG: GntR family transcriptional regulator [Nitriliruptorales bacterium]
MIVEINPASDLPPYEQLRRQVAALIAVGSLPTGTRLPPIRQLAADLDLAAGTVARAYRELERDALVQTRGRHGTVVAAQAGRRLVVDRREQLDAAAFAYAAAAAELGFDEAASVERLRAAFSRLTAA